MATKITEMDNHIKEEQIPGKLETPSSMRAVLTGRCDNRLPHEIAAVILTAAHEVMVRKLACEREIGR